MLSMLQGFLSKVVPVDSFINPPLIDFWKQLSADKIILEIELFGPPILSSMKGFQLISTVSP